MAIQPAQPQTIGGVLDTTFQLYKASVGRVWPICLLLVIASSPPSIYLLLKGGGIELGDPTAAMAAMQDVNYWLMYALSLILTFWIIGALYLKQHAIGTGGELGNAAALQGSLPKIVPLVLTALLFAIAMFVGLVLLVIPGLIVMVSLMLCFNLVMFEGKGPVAALTGSHRLVWGDWWRTAAILTVGVIIVAIIYVAAMFTAGLLIPLIGLEDVVTFSLVTGLVVAVLMNILVTPFYAALLISVYWDLKLRKEGGDLAARVGALNPA